MSTASDRRAEVDALIVRAKNPSDPYDGHHGNDRSEASLAFARQHDPELVRRIEDKILTDAKE